MSCSYAGQDPVAILPHYCLRSEEEEEKEKEDDLLEETMNADVERSPARPGIPFVDSSLDVLITPKKEFSEEIKKRPEATFDGRWSSDDEEEPGLEEVADEDISDFEIKQAYREMKPRRTRLGWGRFKNEDVRGRPICKYCECEFWTLRAKVEHMEVCQFLQCNPKNFICHVCCQELPKKTFSNHVHETLDCPHCGKVFTNVRSQQIHIEKQHGVKPLEEPKQEVPEEPKSADVPDDLPETVVAAKSVSSETNKGKQKLECGMPVQLCISFSLTFHNS